MGILKAEIRADVLFEVGVWVDDQLDIARADCFRFDGARQAVAQIGAKLEPFALAEINDLVKSFALSAEISYQIACGRVEALEKIIARLKKDCDVARQHVLDLRKAEAEDTQPAALPKRAPRIMGTRPVSLVEERKGHG